MLFNLSVHLFCDIVFFTDTVGQSRRKYMVKHKKIISTLYSLRDMFQDTASESDWLYYMFSIFCSPAYIGHTSNIYKRKISHVSCSRQCKPTSHLYFHLNAIGIEHFTFLSVRVPPYLRVPLEKFLIQWFKPSLNTQHNSDFQSNISADPMIPHILKSALTKFKNSSPYSSSSYNINSDKFKSPSFMRMHVVPSKSIPLSLTIYHHVNNNTRSFNLLSLITEFDVNKFHPFHVEVTHGSEDLTNFCFLQREMSDSYAITFSNDAEKLSVHALTTLLKSKEITSFLFIPCAHQILLDYFATSHTLPKIARGSISPLTVLKHSHPLKRF